MISKQKASRNEADHGKGKIGFI